VVEVNNDVGRMTSVNS